MKYFGDGLSDLHKALNAVIRKPDQLDSAKQMFLDLHGRLHLSAVSNTAPNEVDALLGDLAMNEYAIMLTQKDETIAWVLWHTARIEDLTMGMLVAKSDQVFNNDWQARLNAGIIDTGNALSDDQIMALSHQLNINNLLLYRNAVGQRTREIIKQLAQSDMRRSVSAQDIQRIKSSGGVTDQEDSIWLLDFWGKKDVAGLLLMPPTRHVMMHLNDCAKWKQHIRQGKKCFMQ